MPGFEKVMVEPQRRPVEVVLKPHVIKAAYLTYFGVGDRTIRTRVLDLMKRTELNAVVIDVKGHRGPDGGRAGAGDPPRLRRAHARPESARHLHDRAHRCLQGQHPGDPPAR